VKPDKEMTVTIGSDTFKLFGKGDRGFVNDPTEELKLIESMKKGSSAVVRGVSVKGTGTTDTYSLSGLAQALDKMAAACP
jgi:Invasion associated locus B (IalB) protein